MIDLRPWTKAFTLVELLIVLSILSLLIGLLLPALSKARTAARSAVCQTQLHGIGGAFRMYLDDNHDIMPYAAQVPSTEPDMPSIADVLLPFLKETKTMCCPGDRQQTYFDKEGTSYEYPFMLRGKRVNQSFLGKRLGQSKTPVLYDFEPFHNKPGHPGSINFLFGDGHVGDLREQ